MTFLKSQLEYCCDQAELHATLPHCALPVDAGKLVGAPSPSQQLMDFQLGVCCF